MDPTTVAPVDLVVLEFPGSTFTGDIAPALADLTDSGIIRILDMIIIARSDDGSITAIELTDLDDAVTARFDAIDGEAGGLLSDDDIAAAGAAIAPGTTAAVIVWRNVWADRLNSAVAESGGRVVAHDRLDAETVSLALDDLAV